MTLVNLDTLPRTVRWSVESGQPELVLLDQTLLPYEEAYLYLTDWRDVIEAIKSLRVRGAPAIGIAGAAAVALRAHELIGNNGFLGELEASAKEIADARPTAVNLQWAVDNCMDSVSEMMVSGVRPEDVAAALSAHIDKLVTEDEAANRAMGAYGCELLPHNCTVLTHCNAGSLATAFYGTALGVVYSAAEKGKLTRVFADETRPVNQGARLTVWELSKAGVPVTLICDNMAASVMASGMVDAVLVGADRIAANGDAANKIGTLGLAIIAKSFDIPFYVVAPTSTIDLNTPNGASIVIEERSPEEVLPNPIDGVDVYNPAFDVTTADLITKIITERGTFNPNEVASIPQEGHR